MYQKAINQFKHAQKQTDYINKFNSLWVSFNCFYNIEIHKGNDRNKINEIKVDDKIKNSFQKIADNDKKIFFNFIKQRDNKWICNLRDQKIIKYSNMNDVSDFIEIIYTIRNNQFHWWKDWKSESDTILLKQASIIFEEFLTIHYKNYFLNIKKKNIFFKSIYVIIKKYINI